MFYSHNKLLRENFLEEVFQESERLKKNEVSAEDFGNFLKTNSFPANSIIVPIHYHENCKTTIFRIALARLAVALETLRISAKVATSGQVKIVSTFIGFIKEIDIIQDEALKIFWLSLLLNASRALLDTENSILESINYLNSVNSFANLSESEMKYIDRAKKLFLELFKTDCAQKALKVTCKRLSYTEEKTQQILEFFPKCVEKVHFMHALFAGMIGFNEIYIKADVLELQNGESEEGVIARLVGLFFHEAFHLSQRLICENFASQTPRSSKPYNVEGGLLLELFLWGTIEIEYWNEKHTNVVLDKKRWDFWPLFTEEEIFQRARRKIGNSKCSGLCSEFKRWAE